MHETRCGAGSRTFPPCSMTDSRTAKEDEARSTLFEATQFANEVAWKRPDLDILRQEYKGQYSNLVETVQEKILMRHRRYRLILPNLAAFGNEVVGVFSDYGGEHKEARYLTYSVLVCTFDLRDLFAEKIWDIRKEYQLGSKEISYKDFRMVRWPRFVGQLGGLIKVYSGCRSCHQHPFGSIFLPLLLRLWGCGQGA